MYDVIFIKDTAQQGRGRERQSSCLPAPCAQGRQWPLGCGVMLRTLVAKVHINHPLTPCPHHALPLVPGMLQEGLSPYQKRVVSSTVCLEDTEV